MTTTGGKRPVKATKAVDETSELERLRARIAELEGQQETKAMASNHAPVNDEELDDNVKIQQDDYIPVMSLVPYNLNLSTQGFGQGRIKKFTRFGEVKQILYKDLIDIMEVHSNFLHAGYFYIMNPVLVRRHGLEEFYNNILDKERIETILTTKSDECVNLYNSANPEQQELIVQLLIDKVQTNPGLINLNIVDAISRLSKVDIVKRAEEAKEFARQNEAEGDEN